MSDYWQWYLARIAEAYEARRVEAEFQKIVSALRENDSDASLPDN